MFDITARGIPLAVVGLLVMACDRPEPTPEPESSAPALSVSSPVEGALVEGPTLALEGLASDDGAVSEVVWSLDGGAPQPASLEGEDAAATVRAELEVSQNGAHALDVTATDDAGLQTTVSRTFSTLEPNDAVDDASEIALPFESATLHLVEGDTDCYTFTLTDEAPMELALEAPSGAAVGGIQAVLVPHDGGYGQALDLYDGPVILTLEAGAYTLVLTPSDPSSDTGYVLRVGEVTGLEDTYEPNDEPQDATAVALPFSATGLTLLGADVDWFAFTLTASRLVSIALEVQSSGSSWELYGALYQGEEVIRTTDDAGHGALGITVVLGPGTYHVQVLDREDGNSLLAYGLTVGAVEVEDDAWEENDALSTAAPVELPFSSEALQLVYGDPDWFSFNLSEDGYVVLAFSFVGGDDAYQEVSLSLYWEGEHLADWYASSSEPASLTRMLPAGTYQVLVRQAPYAELAEVRYALDIALDPRVVDDGYEPNDTSDTAASLELDLVGEPLILFEGEEDWFDFTLTERRVVTVDVDADVLGSPMRVDLELQDNTGNTITYGIVEPGGEDPRLAEILEPGTYRVRIRGYFDWGSEGYGPYVLTVLSEGIPQDDALEPNDGFSTATAITLPYSNDDLVLAIGSPDWFTFTLAAQRTLYVDVDARSQGSDLLVRLEVVDDVGDYVASGSFGDFGDPYLQVGLPAGTYHLQIFSEQDLSSADVYSLDVYLK